jgi:antitoxin VapB
MQRTAKVFMNNRNQAVRLPKEFQFSTSEVFIRRQGDEIVLSPRPADWSGYLSSGIVSSPGFMEGVDDLPVQERNL